MYYYWQYRRIYNIFFGLPRGLLAGGGIDSLFTCSLAGAEEGAGCVRGFEVIFLFLSGTTPGWITFRGLPQGLLEGADEGAGCVQGLEVTFVILSATTPGSMFRGLPRGLGPLEDPSKSCCTATWETFRRLPLGCSWIVLDVGGGGLRGCRYPF